MPKDFVEFASSPAHQATGERPSHVRDPNLFHNVAVINEISKFSSLISIKMFFRGKIQYVYNI